MRCLALDPAAPIHMAARIAHDLARTDSIVEPLMRMAVHPEHGHIEEGIRKLADESTQSPIVVRPEVELSHYPQNWLSFRSAPTRLEGSVLAQLYRMLLSRRGLISALNGLPWVPGAGEELRASAMPMRHLRDFAAKPQTREQANEHVRRLVTPKRMPRDPLWHLPAITWLAQDWEAFLRQYEAIARLADGRGHRTFEVSNFPFSTYAC